MSERPFLSKAEEALAAAKSLLEEQRFDSAASRAYYAVFHAARAALVNAGLSSPDAIWSHDAIRGAFSQLIHRRKIYPAALARCLPELQEIRLVADYALAPVCSREARLVVKRASEFVALVTEEIQS